MRLVEISVPIGEREAVVGTLEAEGVDYYLTDETSDRREAENYAAIVTFPLPRNAVQPVVDDLRDAGLSQDAHVVISDVEVDLSRRFQRLLRRYQRESNWQIRIAREEVLTRARELSPGAQTFVVLTVVSAVVATAGLLLDSPAVVVGSMVIAPLVGPALSASVGTVLDDVELFRRGVWLQILGVALAVASATAFAVVVRSVPMYPPGVDITRIPEISGRISPDVLSLIIALGAGVAGVLSLSSGVSAGLVGVMIAAALIPPAAAVGVSVAWGEPFAAVSAGVLVLVNVLAINLSALVTLWLMGYRPKSWLKLERSRSVTAQRVAVLVALTLLLSFFLGGVTYSSVQSAQFQRSVRTNTDQLLALPQYDGVQRIAISVRYQGTSLLFPRGLPVPNFPSHRPRQVVVTVGVPTDRTTPRLASRLHARIRESTGHDVAVQVRYVRTESVGRTVSDASTGRRSSSVAANSPTV